MSGRLTSATATRLIRDATTAGKDMITAADAAAQRELLELGTAATADTGDFAATSHTHTIANVTGLQDTLDDKADLVAGKISTIQIPSVAITEYLGEVADQTEMLALSAGDRGDWCVRSDTGSVWVLVADDSSVIESWTELTYPAAPVTSVNGETGTVVLAAADVGAAASSHNHAAGDVTSGTFADARIAESNVTQHEAALSITESQISDLTVAKVYLQVALSANGSAITSGTGKGFVPVLTAGTITAVRADLDPANEATDQSTIVDVNKVDRSTGVATTVLSTRAIIPTGENTNTATVDGTQAVSVGDWLQIDVDQGSDGQDLICTVEITPS